MGHTALPLNSKELEALWKEYFQDNLDNITEVAQEEGRRGRLVLQQVQ